MGKPRLWSVGEGAHTVRSLGTNKDATIALNRALCREHLVGLEETYGVRSAALKSGMKGAKWDSYFGRCAEEEFDGVPEELLKDVQTRSSADGFRTEHEEHEQAMVELFEIDGKAWQTRMAAPRRERFERESVKILSGMEAEAARLHQRGYNSRQIVCQLDALERRALDPATDAGSVGITYKDDVFRKVILSGQLRPQIPTIVLGRGERTYHAPILDPARVLLTAANTTDAYNINSTEDPANDSVEFVPVKLMGGTFWNGEFDEDSLWEVVPGLRKSLEIGFAIALDTGILNGDTTNTAAANINAKYGSQTLGTKDPRLAWNGLRGLFYRGTHGSKSANTFAGGIDGGGNNATLNDVYDVLKDLDKYGISAEDLRGVCSVQTWWNLRNDAKGQYFGRDIVNEDCFGFPWLKLANGKATAAASSNIPTDALGVFEGCPTNLNSSGVFDNATMTLSTFGIFNRVNSLFVVKRDWNVKVVDLDLGDQKAIVGSFRGKFGEIIANEPWMSWAYNVL